LNALAIERQTNTLIAIRIDFFLQSGSHSRMPAFTAADVKERFGIKDHQTAIGFLDFLVGIGLAKIRGVRTTGKSGRRLELYHVEHCFLDLLKRKLQEAGFTGEEY
jgi:hypothetical protein